MQHSGKSYDRLAWLYDAAAHLYSGGQINALKASQIAELQPGHRILYAGVGAGEDAVLAAKRDVRLTVLDASQLMLERAASKFHAAGIEDSIEVICSDVLKHERPAYYDVVVANARAHRMGKPYRMITGRGASSRRNSSPMASLVSATAAAPTSATGAVSSIRPQLALSRRSVGCSPRRLDQSSVRAARRLLTQSGIWRSPTTAYEKLPRTTYPQRTARRDPGHQS